MGRILRVVLLSCVLFVPSWGALEAGTAESAASADYRKICTYYESRARARARDGEQSFAGVLSHACEGSLASLASEEPARSRERTAARVFLDRLVELRRTISAMNLARIEGGRNSIIVLPKQGGGALRGIPQVSATGEFLIAHRMGLMTALEAWVGTGGDFSLAER